MRIITQIPNRCRTIISHQQTDGLLSWISAEQSRGTMSTETAPPIATKLAAYSFGKSLSITMRVFVVQIVHLALITAILVSPGEDSCYSWHPSYNRVVRISAQQAGSGDMRNATASKWLNSLDGNNNSSSTEAKIKPSADNNSTRKYWQKNFLPKCDFGGQRLPIAVSQQPPLVNCFQDIYGDWMCNGSNIEVINVLEQRLNFRADWLVLSNGHLDSSLSGYRSDTSFSNRRQSRAIGTMFCDASLFNKTERDVDKSLRQQRTSNNYTGVLGLVGSGRACLSANGIMRTKERERDFILSEPFDSFRLHLLLSKWVRDHDHIFIKPFNASTWLAILSSAILVVPIFYLINTTSSHYHLNNARFITPLRPSNYFRYFFVSKLSKLLFRRSVKKRRKSSSSSTSFAKHLEKVASSGGSVIHHLMLHHQSDEQSPAVAKLLMKRERRANRRALQRRWLMEQKEAKKARKNMQRTGFFKCAYILWYVAGSLAGQGGETEDLPHASSTRILIASWWLYLIVMSSIHSGILTAILTFPKQNDFIQTLDDFLALDTNLLGSDLMRLAVERNSEVAQLMSSLDNLHKSSLQVLLAPGLRLGGGGPKKPPRIAHPIVQVDFQRHRQRILDEVQRGECAYLEEKATINLIITQEYFDHKPPKCLFKASRYPMDTIPMTLVLSKHLPKVCVDSINELLVSIMRTGLAQKWRRKYEPTGNDCLETVIINAGDVDKIQLRHVELAFWLLLAGLLIGLSFLLIEIVWLFTIDMEDDDDHDEDVSEGSTCSSSCTDGMLMSSTTSDSSSDERRSSKSLDNDDIAEGLVLGHRRFQLMQRRKLRVQRPRTNWTWQSGISKKSPGAAEKVKTPGSRRQRRAIRAAERRARLLRRTMQLARRLHEGKIYSDLFVKFSHKFQAEARRKSLARESRKQAPAMIPAPIRRDLSKGGPSIRHRSTGRQSKIAPLSMMPR